MRKLLKFIILALISTAIICGCIFVGMYAIEEENGGTGSSSDSADESSTDSGGSSDSSQPSSDYEGAGSGTLSFGSAYSWGSTSDVCAISYSSTMTYQTKATVKIGATTYTATSVTATINPDVYDELEAAGAFSNDGITDSLDITSNFTMASVFDNLIYYNDNNISDIADLLSGYYTAGTPAVIITATYNKSYATFGLLVDVEGMYYTITYSEYQAHRTVSGSTIGAGFPAFTYIYATPVGLPEKVQKGTEIEFEVVVDWCAASGYMDDCTITCDFTIYATDDSETTVTYTSSCSHQNDDASVENDYSDYIHNNTDECYYNVYTICFTMPAYDVTVYVNTGYES